MVTKKRGDQVTEGGHDEFCEKLAGDLADLKTEVALTKTFSKYNKESIIRHKTNTDKQIEKILTILEDFTAVVEVVKRHDKWISKREDWKNNIINHIYGGGALVLLSWLAYKLGFVIPK